MKLLKYVQNLKSNKDYSFIRQFESQLSHVL